MAITFKKNNESYGYSLLPLFGVSPSLIEKAFDLGVTIDSTSPGNFYVKHGDSGFGSVQVKGQAISLAKSGSLGPASKDAIKFQFESALTKACTYAANFAPKSEPKNPEAQYHKLENVKLTTFDSKSIADAMAEAVEVGVDKAVLAELKKSASKKSTNWPFETLSKKADTSGWSPDVIELADANTLLQKVKGTSNNSIYVVAALFDGCQVAVRTTANKLSVRVAGSNLSKYKDGLEAVGMDLKSDYASCHYSINYTDKPLLKKTLGAIFASLGFERLKAVSPLAALIGG